MLKNALAAIALWSVLFVNVGFADSLYGTCKRRDGSNVDRTARISTSWNNNVAFPRSGRYQLDFGGKVGKRITVYVDGKRYGTVFVKGNTQLNLVID